MSITKSFEEFSNILRRIESAEWRIEYVETDEGRWRSEEPLQVRIGVSPPLLDTLRDEGNVRIEGLDRENATSVIDVTILPEEGEGDIDPLQETPEKANGSDVADENRSNGQSTSDRRQTDGNGELRAKESDESPPPHHDPERLREVYEEHETFAEMTDALGVDVSPQTVRHFMIRHGVHEPATQSSDETEGKDNDGEDERDRDRQPDSDTDHESGGDESDKPDEPSSDDHRDRKRHSNGDADTTSAVDRSADEDERTDTDAPNGPAPGDEIGPSQLEEVSLPDDISIEDVKGAVQSASTMHEVQRALDLEGAETRNLLQELNLIDLVTGRLAYKPNQDTSLDELETATDSTEEIEKRIHDALNSASTSKV